MILFALALVAMSQAPDSGAVLYRRWCSSCHGADGSGVASASTKLDVQPAPLGECRTSTAEPEELWVDMVTHGGEAFGLSLDMPSYGDGATPEQIRAVVRHAKSLCRERGWPPGELNFPRPQLAEKAFPENEWVIGSRGNEQKLIYERRFGRRLQLEGIVRTATDAGDPFAGVTAAAKYNMWHSLERLALASVGLEVTPPLGRQDLWEIEPFVAAGWSPGGAFIVQAAILAVFEEFQGFTKTGWRMGVGKELGRFVPMLEAGLDVPRQGDNTLVFMPQVWMQLSRLGHVAGSIGVALPAVGPEPRRPQLALFVLWDFGDGGLWRGW